MLLIGHQIYRASIDVALGQSIVMPITETSSEVNSEDRLTELPVFMFL